MSASLCIQARLGVARDRVMSGWDAVEAGVTVTEARHPSMCRAREGGSFVELHDMAWHVCEQAWHAWHVWECTTDGGANRMQVLYT